jgi:hypothetical protein
MGKMATRRRDRRGRGLRGVLAPRSVPLRRSRSDAFDDLVVESAVRLQRRWGGQLRAVEFLVEDVPPGEDGGERARATLVHDVVVEQVAELLGLEPETVDPDYGLD